MGTHSETIQEIVDADADRNSDVTPCLNRSAPVAVLEIKDADLTNFLLAACGMVALNCFSDQCFQ